MKKLIVLFVLAAMAVLCLTACESHEGQVQIGGVWVDEEGVERVKDGFEKYNQLEAESNGNSYCKDCGKYIEGTVSICPYCGQYID